MARAAIFIDGGYLDFLLREEFDYAKIDYFKLVEKMRQGIDLLRAYYYHCLPYQSSPPTKEESERFGKAQQFIYSLNKLPQFEVRLGKLACRGINKETGKMIFEQRQVDLLLGTDLALLSGKSQITHAIILAGDSDFLPAIEVAKKEGVLIRLYYGDGCHDDLWNMADERLEITKDMIKKIKYKKTTPSKTKTPKGKTRSGKRET